MKTAILCAPQCAAEGSGSMFEFLSATNSALIRAGITPYTISAELIADPKHARLICKLLQKFGMPWIFIFWIQAFVLWRQLERPAIIAISQEYALPFGLQRQICIFHDAIQFFYPRNFSALLLYRWYLPWVYKKLWKVYAPSRTSARIIKRLYGLREVGLCGVPLRESDQRARASGMPSRRKIDFEGIWVGTLAKHKNFQLLLELVKCCDRRFAAVLPVQESIEANRLAGELDSSGRLLIFCDLQSSQLQALYYRSRYVISTSRIEGFGMPLLEGAMSGCKILCTDIPTFFEIYGSIALLLNRHNFVADASAKILRSDVPVSDNFYAESQVCLTIRHLNLTAMEEIAQLAKIQLQSS